VSVAARETATLFSWERTARETVDFYCGLMQGTE